MFMRQSVSGAGLEEGVDTLVREQPAKRFIWLR